MVWAAAAAVAQLTILSVLPIAAGIPAEWGTFGLIAGTLVIASGVAVARSERRTAWRLVLGVSAMWFVPFLFEAVVVLGAPVYSPLAGVEMFFVCAAGAGAHAAARSGRAGLGIAASVASGSAIAVFTAVVFSCM